VEITIMDNSESRLVRCSDRTRHRDRFSTHWGKFFEILANRGCT
jgi:hypothetical protein